jgi:hypothetical protein
MKKPKPKKTGGGEPPIQEDLDSEQFPDDDEELLVDDFGDDLDDDLDDELIDDEDFDEPTNPGFHESDSFDEISGASDAQKQLHGQQNKEITLGAWRDRAFAPRGTMSKVEILKGLERALKLATIRKTRELARVRKAFKAEILPLLMEGVEQAGGDGVDAYLSSLSDPQAKPAKESLVKSLGLQMVKVNKATSVVQMVEEGKKVVDLLRKAMGTSSAKKLSHEKLEAEFEGKLSIDAILAIFFGDDAELKERLSQLDGSLENLRAELRAMPGGQPQGLMWNFSRLKVERKVVDSEIKRREAKLKV